MTCIVAFFKRLDIFIIGSFFNLIVNTSIYLYTCTKKLFTSIKAYKMFLT